ncbi:RagB/SusD family nutrient uptake outer membrane protein [Bacteroides sp.]|uniref:RagB/SusD family nutrient uptake outer membrane protein n=1 Tax=Bacteroides sp. TaxID=29523 RepID=UPI002FC6A71E
MKTKIILFLTVVSMTFGGCTFLDYDESSFYKKEDVFSSFQRSKEFLANIYSYLPTKYGLVGGSLRSAACDEAIWVEKLSVINRFNNGSWNAINTVDNSWHYFAGIRAVNLFVEEVKGQEFDELKNNQDYAEMMNQFKYYPYEARFLRAYFYFELAKRYGDIPLIITVLTSDEANKLERTPFEQVIDFIVSECTQIAPELPVNYNNITQQEVGRITRGAALALKSKALLYAASPLFNTGQDKTKWEKAAKAAADVIKIAGASGYTPLPKLSNLWNKNYAINNELILGIIEGESNSFELANFPVGIEGGGTTGTCPSQNLVDAFEMQATGLPISDEAGYQQADLAYDSQNPYVGRDPRLNASIVVNNSVWVYGEKIECWTGGRSGAPVNYATATGYYLKKYVDSSVSLKAENITSKRHVWNIIRYSEILLNYAEAMINAYGNQNYKSADLPMSAAEAVNMVRARQGVNMPPFPNTLSPEEFLKKLKNERMIELAFEDQRFWDIRRWKEGAKVADIYGVQITRNGDHFNYKKVLVEKRVFDEKMYLYPIPQSEMLINKQLKQNAGWN